MAKRREYKTQRSRKPFMLGLDPTVYNLQAIRDVDIEDLKKEYRRERREALDRLRGFARSAEYSKTAYYREHKDLFAETADKLTKRQLEKKVIEASKFLLSERSSVSGQKAIRARVLNTLHARGITFVNTKNYKQFWDFLDWYDGRYKDKGYVGSPTADDTPVKVFADAVVNKGVDVDTVKRLFGEYVANVG